MTDFDYRKLDALIHSRIRLSVMSILAAVDFAEFRYLRDRVGATDGNLGTHLSKLEAAGYVEVAKLFVEKKPVSRYSLTGKGRAAFRAYLSRLQDMVGGVGPE